LSLSTKSNAFVSGSGLAIEDSSQLTRVERLSNPRDRRYIGAQDALLGAGGNDGVMPYISKRGEIYDEQPFKEALARRGRAGLGGVRFTGRADCSVRNRRNEWPRQGHQHGFLDGRCQPFERDLVRLTLGHGTVTEGWPL
jgi:hypothetical protein